MGDFLGPLVAIVTLGVSVVLITRWAIQSSTCGTGDAELDAVLLLEPFMCRWLMREAADRCTLIERPGQVNDVNDINFGENQGELTLQQRIAFFPISSLSFTTSRSSLLTPRSEMHTVLI